MMKKAFCTAALAAFCCASGAKAEEQRTWAWSPIGIGIAAPIQLP